MAEGALGSKPPADGATRSLSAGHPGLRPLAIVAVVAAVVSAALWVPLGEPLLFLRNALPAGAFLGSIALGAIVFVVRRPLQVFASRLARVLPAGYAAPPLLATVLFALSWAGAHAGRGTDVGLLPQLIFPAVSGVFAFSVARYGQTLQGRAGGYFRARDHLGPRWRFILLMVLTTAASYALARVLGASGKVLTEQLLVVIGMLAGYLLLAPGLTRPTAAPK